ncbi:succinate-semialdehyde dehydrogenase / glutarate-semialdehyde dehydrogenase [Candidatus Planktophila lacus]|jgi:succinate-semialdehyde dehydrogenase/glutarate-semialdehyde dehydrogenase|uniref:NAD-dependent succinate-semialdehyde dehydrogenase n=1 Tax=Candidatus Planktophila lacus TaxID=1884913 RepID=UPI000BAC8937|nr:NAD-dependent succinate-semialdehyde dehydrogenase [Candidatus Planktophila lacus]ASY29600.1 succinate-semialdehyde dehydrogenase / glutarate-semialdehyde dehydrogenase [Candidatus Planktophila lacus]
MRTQLYIDGQWVDGNGTLDVTDPSDGSVIAKVATAGDAQIEAALAAAHRAAPAWAKTAPRVRAEMLRKAFELMIQEADYLAELISKENGKALPDAKGEVAYAAEFFRWFSEEAVRIAGDFRMSPSGDKRILVTHQPVGLSLLITPWNFPAGMATRKIGPAIAAGCTMILKPAGETPLTALAIMDILDRAGVPKGVVNLILPTPTGPAIAKMLHDPRVKNLSFTGSTEVGRIILKEAADNVIRCSMELGGNAPFVVMDDANIDEAIKGLMLAKMRNGGAACTAANRVYVQRKVAAEFMQKFAEAMGTFVMGRGRDAGVQLGASVSIKERNKIAELVDNSVKSGAKVLTGGKTPDGPGAFYPATVLEVEKTAEILNHEVFGPVAPVVIFDTDAEAIELANSTDFGLISYVYSEDLKRAIQISEALESGMVAINRGMISDPAAPFGGVKQSGLGREGGFDGIHEFLETKYIGVEI